MGRVETDVLLEKCTVFYFLVKSECSGKEDPEPGIMVLISLGNLASSFKHRDLRGCP